MIVRTARRPHLRTARRRRAAARRRVGVAPGGVGRPVLLLAASLLLAAALLLSPPPLMGQAAPAAPRAIASWTSDRVELGVGDVVTILVDEYTLASANRDELEAEGHIRDVGITGGTVGGRMGGGVRTTNDVEDSRFGDTSRQDRFRAEISARVVEVEGSSFRIEGTKQVQIDDHEQEIRITGWIRAHDVTSANTVDSWRIADARVAYGSNGELGKTGGIWSTILGLLIP